MPPRRPTVPQIKSPQLITPSVSSLYNNRKFIEYRSGILKLIIKMIGDKCLSTQKERETFYNSILSSRDLPLLLLNEQYFLNKIDDLDGFIKIILTIGGKMSESKLSNYTIITEEMV